MYIDSGHVSHEVHLRLKMEDFYSFGQSLKDIRPLL